VQIVIHKGRVLSLVSCVKFSVRCFTRAEVSFVFALYSVKCPPINDN
jgi:hypothetical protein